MQFSIDKITFEKCHKNMNDGENPKDLYIKPNDVCRIRLKLILIVRKIG